MGLLTPRTLFAHCIWLGARDWRRLARAAVAHCPTSNVFLGSGVMDWKRAPGGARRARIGRRRRARPVDLQGGPHGVDGALARRRARRRPAELMRAATLGGAEALGFEDEIGSLEAGKAADFVVLDRDHIVPPGAPSDESTDDLLLANPPPRRPLRRSPGLRGRTTRVRERPVAAGHACRGPGGSVNTPPDPFSLSQRGVRRYFSRSLSVPRTKNVLRVDRPARTSRATSRTRRTPRRGRTPPRRSRWPRRRPCRAVPGPSR